MTVEEAEARERERASEGEQAQETRNWTSQTQIVSGCIYWLAMCRYS